jgi:ABC-type sugar transport system substrate-binding protein
MAIYVSYKRRLSPFLVTLAPLGVFVLLVLTLSLGCSGPGKQEVALALKTLTNPYYIVMRKGAEAEALSHPEINLIVQATRVETDALEQNQLVENLLSRGVKALCLTPDDSKAAVAAVVKANARSVPVIIVDTKLDPAELSRQHGHIAAFIGSDNKKGGFLAARTLAEALARKGNVAIIEGAPGQETAVSRKQGFLDGIVSFPNIKVVASQPASWEREKGYAVTQAILVAHPDLDGLFACNDEMALGAVQAAKEMKRKLLIVGFDYTPDGRAAVESGDLVASIAQDPEEMGRLAIRTAALLLNGKEVDPNINVPVVVKRAAK